METLYEGAQAGAMPTLREALGVYLKTITPYKKGHRQEAGRIKYWLLEPMAAAPLDRLRGVDFAHYRDRRLAMGISRSSVRLELAIISHLYGVAAIDWGHDGLKNPIRQMRMPAPVRGRSRRLLAGEEDALLAAADAINPAIKSLILFTLETAMRRGELVALQWSAVNEKWRACLLMDTKNGDDRTVPLSSRALAVLAGIPRTDDRVFPFSANYVSVKFCRACRLAGIKNLRFHDLRHEATSRLFELGRLTAIEISLITGHKSLTMLSRYTHLTASHLAAKLG
jgi:integrase